MIQACNVLLKAVSSTYEITGSRMTCQFNKLQKRAIDDGLATLTVSETSDFASQGGDDSGVFFSFLVPIKFSNVSKFPYILWLELYIF
jgi:hypothetical protein